jgi:hypothetical protein
MRFGVKALLGAIVFFCEIGLQGHLEVFLAFMAFLGHWL